jgi:hypothetical protein
MPAPVNGQAPAAAGPAVARRRVVTVAVVVGPRKRLTTTEYGPYASPSGIKVPLRMRTKRSVDASTIYNYKFYLLLMTYYLVDVEVNSRHRHWHRLCRVAYVEFHAYVEFPRLTTQ